MADVEILGKPQYRSRKLQDEEQNSSTQQKSKKRLSESDLQYERDEQNSLVKPKPEESKKSPLNTDFVYERDEGD